MRIPSLTTVRGIARLHARPLVTNHRSYHVNGVPQTVPHAWDRGYPLREGRDKDMDIAIIGGGITGLAAAYFLFDLPVPRGKLKVTIYEGSDRLGGWMQSERVEVRGGPSGGGRVLFETGPRTLRPKGGEATLRLVDELNLYDDLCLKSKSSPAAQNRFVYYPDRLVRMPSSLSDVPDFLFQEPLGQGFLRAALKEVLVPYDVGQHREDVSVGELLSTRLGPQVADLASAVFHGIYAGDIDKLSAAALLGPSFDYTHRFGGIIRGMVKKQLDWTFRRTSEIAIPERYDLFSTHASPRDPFKMAMVASSSIFSFRQGMSRLAQKLEEVLRGNANITIKRRTEVTGLEVRSSSRPGVVMVSTKGAAKPQRHTQAICTIPSAKLAPLVRAPGATGQAIEQLREILGHNTSVTVLVVNLYFDEPKLVPVTGFGYLIPRHVPAEQNPEGALGVVFDSDAISGQDDVAQPGTKLTVMLGGHQWEQLRGVDLQFSEQEGVELARAVLARHLGITAWPRAARATLQRDCIPQYLVGHRARMARLHDLLVGPGFDGALMVAGAGYANVSVNGCVDAGFRAARMVSRGVLDSGMAAPTEWPCFRTTKFRDINIKASIRVQ